MHRALIAIGRMRRGMTIGVRGVLFADQEVWLVRHSYISGWYLPGGGVEAGETLVEALRREMKEEVGAALTGPAQLFGVYRNALIDPRDHVALFVCRDFAVSGEGVRNLEIREARAFPLAALPDDATPATRARLGEVLHGRAPAVDW